jgi:hypothetical protein
MLRVLEWLHFIAVLPTAASKAATFTFEAWDFCSTFLKKWKKENPCNFIARALAPP